MITCNGRVFGNYHDLWQAYKPKKGCVSFVVIESTIPEYVGEPLGSISYILADVIVKPKFYKDGELDAI